MHRPLLLVLLVVPALAHAVICKTVDSEGVIGYTDVPVGECLNPVDLPDYSRYAPRPIERPDNTRGASGNVINFQRYTSLRVLKPAANGTERSNEGRVTVVLQLEPGLQRGHHVRLFLDGREVPGQFDGTAIEMTGVERGSHGLRARVFDAAGRALIESPSVRFTLRKRGLFEGEDSDAEPPPDPDPGYPAPTTPPGYGPAGPADYTPPSSPGYAPPGGGIPATPGATNPAFKPNYTP